MSRIRRRALVDVRWPRTQTVAPSSDSSFSEDCHGPIAESCDSDATGLELFTKFDFLCLLV